MNDLTARAQGLRGALLICFAAGGLMGCANPLAISTSDFARVPEDRIATIRSLKIEPAGVDDSNTVDGDLPSTILGSSEVTELSLDAVRRHALENNLDLRAAAFDSEIAQQAVDEEIARFDSVFRIDASYSETDTPTSSTLNNAQADQVFVQPALIQPLLTGGSVELSLPLTRSSTNNQFTTLDPAFESDFVVRLTQPLLRGGGRERATANVRIAGIERAVAEVRTRAAVTTTLSGVDRTYWELWASRRQLELRIEEFEVARDVLAQAERLVEAGAAAEIEVIRAQAGVSDLLSGILQIEQIVLRRQRELKRAMNLGSLRVSDESIVVPTTDPSPAPLDLDRDALLDVAAETRSELLELELQLIADATRIDAAENDRLPQLDLTASYRRNGLGDGFDSSIEQLYQDDFSEYSVGVTASIPIGNRAADARLRRATLQRLSRIATRDAREQTIEQDVLDAVERIRSDWQRIIAGRQSVTLNARSLAAEQRQFQEGLSNSVDVLQAAGRLAAARAEEIRAVADYELARIALAEATGTVVGFVFDD
ncbi:MAG: TolC family protein [Planctomycetota bacterium]